MQIQTLGTPSSRSSVTSLWGPKALDHIVDVDLRFEVERERSTVKRLQRLAKFHPLRRHAVNVLVLLAVKITAQSQSRLRDWFRNLPLVAAERGRIDNFSMLMDGLAISLQHVFIVVFVFAVLISLADPESFQ